MRNNRSAAAPAFLAMSCIGFIASAPAFAQDAAPPAEEQATELQGVTVESTAITSEIKRDRVESPKATAPLLDTPQTITVIGKESIQQQNLLTLRDVLQTVPGITFGAGEGGFGYGDRIILRGQDAKNDVTIDGVRSSAFLNRNETYNIEQIEVTNGANSVNNGSGSIAGTINLVTKRPSGENATTFQGSVGTDNYYRGTVDSNILLNDNIAFRLNAVYHENDVPGRKVEDYKRWGVAPSITIGINSPTTLTLQAEHLDDKAMPQYGLRYYANLGGYLPEFDRAGYYGFANLDRQNSKTDSLQAIFSHEFSDTMRIRNLTRFEKIRQDTVTSQPTGTFCLGATNLQPTAPGAAAGANCNVAIQTLPTAGGVVPAAATLTIPAGYYQPTGGRATQRFITNETWYDQLDFNAEFDTGGMAHSLNIGVSGLWEGFEQLQGNNNRTAEGYDPYAAPYTRTTTNGVTTVTANPLYNAAASLGFYLPLVSISNPGAVVAGPAAPAGTLARAYGSNIYTGPVNFIRSSRNQGERTAYAAYLFDTIKFGEMFELNGGLRYEQNKGFNRTYTYSTTPGATLGQLTTPAAGATNPTQPLRNKDNLFSYRVGAVFKPTPDTSLYAAYGVAKSPSQASVDASCAANNCNLKPETAENYEIGAKADLFDKRLLLSVSAFRNNRDSIRVASNDPTLTDQRQDGKQRVEGISLGASGNITDAWTISANYMYLKSKIIQGLSDVCIANPGITNAVATCAGINSAAFPDPTRGYSLTNTPKHSGSLFTTYRFDFGLELGYGLTYQGKFLLNQPTLAELTAGTYVGYYVPSYTIHRFSANYTISDNLQAQVNVQNFTNEKYVTTVRNSIGQSWASPAPTRQAIFSLIYKL